MEGESDINDIPGMGVVTEPVSEVANAVVVGSEEKQNYDGGRGVLAIGGGQAESSTRRKRGRPRKQQGTELVVMPESSGFSQKRGRGRPRGSGKWQTLAASLGGTAADSAGSKFTPHAITIQMGENIVQRICSFCQGTSESFCILSASGSVSSAEIRQGGSGGGILRFEGLYEIVSLSGSYLDSVASGTYGKVCLLSVQLASPDGGLIGGAVAGSLVAGGPTQLVIGTFRQKSAREQVKARHYVEPPKPNMDVVAAVPLQEANGEFPEAEVNGPATVSPVPTLPTEGGEDAAAMNGRDMNYASPQPFDWSSLQSTAARMPPVIPDVNNRGVAD